MKIVKNFLLNLFFPKLCLGCQKEGTYLCQDCQSILDVIEFHRPFKTEYLDDLYFPLDYQKNSYNFRNLLIKKLIKKFKYNPFVKNLSQPLSQLIINHFELCEKSIPFVENKKDFVIVPVPLSKRRLRWRGFNQAEEIAKHLSKKLQIPLLNNLLFKKKKTKIQSQLSKKERKQNLKNTFSCSRKIKRKILLIDDVYTTGSTMNECAKKLKQAKAKQIIGITVARTQLRKSFSR